MLIALVLLPLVLISTGADSSGANKTMTKALCYHCFPLADPKNLHQLRKKSTDLSPFFHPCPVPTSDVNIGLFDLLPWP